MCSSADDDRVVGRRSEMRAFADAADRNAGARACQSLDRIAEVRVGQDRTH